MTTAKTKGSGFLKVTGILMIIGGGISIILGIIAALGVAALAYISDGEISSAMLYASVALMIVSAVAQLIAGIIGVKNCKKPEKAGTCMVWGVIVAVLCVFTCSLHHRRWIQQKRVHCMIIHTRKKACSGKPFSKINLNLMRRKQNGYPWNLESERNAPAVTGRRAGLYTR